MTSPRTAHRLSRILAMLPWVIANPGAAVDDHRHGILGQALALVERRRIQAGAPRQAGGCQAMHGLKVIDGPPDLFMLQHGTYVFSSVFS